MAIGFQETTPFGINIHKTNYVVTPSLTISIGHFLKMQEYDFDAPQQIHIEELLYAQKQKKKKR